MNMIDFSRIKLVIWDLDDTFWQGILSEGEINPIHENCILVKELSRRGIVNSICSKNDFAPLVYVYVGVRDSICDEHFLSVPKTQRISSRIEC